MERKEKYDLCRSKSSCRTNDANICNEHKESTSRINVVRLGTMEKAFKATSRDYDEKMHNSRIKMLPRGEAIKYRDVSIVINFLLSSRSKAINGNIIRLDNGESVRGNN